MAEESKRAELQKEDRISDLPDFLIQHILGFIPSMEAIRTSVLSKRWHNQWTLVPVLDFNRYVSFESDEAFSRFIDNTLSVSDCSKIQKFRVIGWADPHFTSKLSFAVRKNVEELILDFKEKVRLPDFLLIYSSLVKLQIHNCLIMSNESVRWEQLRELKLESPGFSDLNIKDILIGSPLLERLEITGWYGCFRTVISSRSLKTLILKYGVPVNLSRIEISCPKLLELKHSGLFTSVYIEIKDSSNLIRATLDFSVVEDDENLVDFLHPLQHVKALTFGNYFIRALKKLRYEAGKFSPLLKNKILILDRLEFGEFPAGIEYAIRISPELEKLIIKDLVYYYKTAGYSTKYWVSKGKASKSLLPNLRTVHIVGRRERYKCGVPQEFVDFVLNNAPVLENLAVLKIVD